MSIGSRKKRKVIQMFFAAHKPGFSKDCDDAVMVVLCDDGSMWTLVGSLSQSSGHDWNEMIGPEESESFADEWAARELGAGSNGLISVDGTDYNRLESALAYISQGVASEYQLATLAYTVSKLNQGGDDDIRIALRDAIVKAGGKRLTLLDAGDILEAVMKVARPKPVEEF